MKRVHIRCYFTAMIIIFTTTPAGIAGAQSDLQNSDNLHSNNTKSIVQVLSPTPIPANIPRNTPLPMIDPVSTPTFTPTATQQQFVTLSVRSDILESVNVRSEPDPESAIVGVINVGESYPVTGQYFLWFRLRFDESPNGQAWVFSDLVTITGDLSLVPDLSTEPEATIDPTIVGATQTWQVITLTPGGELTATASSRILDDPIDVDNNGATGNADLSSGLPTFTPPPNSNLVNQDASVLAQPSQSFNVSQTSLPPILPVLVLGGLGLFGFVLSSIRK